MKKRHKKEELTMIDLNERGKIKIIHSSNKEVSKNDMQKFENKLLERYTDYCAFTNLCIKRNKEKTIKQFLNKILWMQ